MMVPLPMRAPAGAPPGDPGPDKVLFMPYINDLTREEIRAILEERGEPSYRAAQVCEWLYRRRAPSFEVMTNLSLDLRRGLAQDHEIARLSEVRALDSREEAAAKYLLRLPDGSRVESVVLGHPRGATVCISSQVGCAYGCTFCATGTMRFKRNLTPAEITDQIAFIEERLALSPGGREGAGPSGREARHFSNVVFMGMGEPLANYSNLTKAIHIMIEEMGIGARRITVSTCGLAREIGKFAREPYEVGLAISLNAVTDEKRREIMPRAGRVVLRDLIDAARRYFDAKGRLLTFEYVLMDRVNDSVEDARRLAALLHDVPAKINLISLNPFPGCPFGPPSPEAVRRFQLVLEERGKTVTLRKSLGSDILAGCGQLGARRRERGRRK
jgi:23S rRNA (adenine2503-C2)-methyltransferase